MSIDFVGKPVVTLTRIGAKHGVRPAERSRFATSGRRADRTVDAAPPDQPRAGRGGVSALSTVTATTAQESDANGSWFGPLPAAAERRSPGASTV
jgi:hypothetical protein